MYRIPLLQGRRCGVGASGHRVLCVQEVLYLCTAFVWRELSSVSMCVDRIDPPGSYGSGIETKGER